MASHLIGITPVGLLFIGFSGMGLLFMEFRYDFGNSLNTAIESGASLLYFWCRIAGKYHGLPIFGVWGNGNMYPWHHIQTYRIQI